MSARDMSGCTLVCHAPNATRCDREHADKHLHLHRCTAYKNHCGTHGFIHGGEAEELRIAMVLDEVDARDSIAFRGVDAIEASSRQLPEDCGLKAEDFPMSETCLHGIDFRGQCRACDELLWLREEVSRLLKQRDALAVKAFEIDQWFQEAKARVATLETAITKAQQHLTTLPGQENDSAYGALLAVVPHVRGSRSRSG